MKKLTEECGKTFVDIESFQGLEKQLAQQKALLDLAGELLVEVDDLFGQHMDERWHNKLNQILGNKKE